MAVGCGLNRRLHYTDIAGRHMPVNYRIGDKSEGKTKNDYFREMLLDVLAWGLKPAFVTGDAWYSCVKNLKTIKNHRTGFMFAVKSNRTVSLEKGQWQQVQTLKIPDDGLDVWLKDFGNVRLFRTTLKDQRRHYVVYLPEDTPFQLNATTSLRYMISTGRSNNITERSGKFAILSIFRCVMSGL